MDIKIPETVAETAGEAELLTGTDLCLGAEAET